MEGHAKMFAPAAHCLTELKRGKSKPGLIA